MTRVLITSSALSELERTEQPGALRAAFRPLRRGFLLAADLDGREADRLGSELDGALADRPVSVPVVGDAVVTGEPMDYHGQGAPVPTRRALRQRVGGNDVSTGEGVLVGVVDTGVSPHPWLAGGYLSSVDDFEPSPDTAAARERQQAGHGTFVAGLVLQQAPAAGVWVERALELDGSGLVSRVAEAALQLAARGVDVLNLSLGCWATDREAAEVVRALVRELHAVNPEMVVVAAAGNLSDDDRTGLFWPAADPGVVSVGAVASPVSTEWSQWSNRGPWVDLAAPGEHLLSTYLVARLQGTGGPQRYHGWATWSGTSFAAAVVSGAIARLMTGPQRLSAQQAVARLRAGQDCRARTRAHGDTPSVPVVDLATWPEQEAAREQRAAS